MATNALYHPMLTAAGQTAVEASLHTGDPGATGANEVPSTDGYARQPVGWNAPTGGTMQADGPLVFNVPALGAAEVTHVGLWNSTGDFLEAAPASTPQPYPSPGTATVAPLVLDMNS